MRILLVGKKHKGLLELRTVLFVCMTVVLLNGCVTTGPIRERSTGTISGRVGFEGGSGARGMTVSCASGVDEYYATTDADGYYTIRRVPQGVWTVSLYRTDSKYRTEFRNPVSADSTGIDLVILSRVAKQNPEPDTAPPDVVRRIEEESISVLKTAVITTESLALSSREVKSRVCRDGITKSLARSGFRIIEPARSISYTSPPAEIRRFTKAEGIDFLILGEAESSKVDKFGDFYSFKGNVGVKVFNIDGELVTEKTFSGRGKRELDETKAAESALTKLSTEVADHVVHAVVGKAPGLLICKVRVTNLRGGLPQVNRFRDSLSGKRGIRNVSLKNYDRDTKTADFEVLYSSRAKEKLVSYIEKLPRCRMKVQKHGAGYIEARKY